MSTINSVTAAAYTTTVYESKAAAKKENTEATTEKSYGKDVGVVYEKSSKTVENAGTYKKTSGKTNTALIEKMKADTANRTNQLRRLGCQKAVSSFLIGNLHKAESILFRCTKIRKSKSA